MKLKHLVNALSIIKNGYQRNVTCVSVLNTVHVHQLLECLWKEGYIQSFSQISNSDLIQVSLKYVSGKKAIRQLNLISKPSWKKFISTKTLIVKKKRNFWIDTIILTSKGIQSTRNLLKGSVLGGIMLCEII